MKIKTFEEALILTRKQAVNLLEGRYEEYNGIPPETRFMGRNDCYGCEYVHHKYTGLEPKDTCEQSTEKLDCPCAVLASRVNGTPPSWICTINDNVPETLFKAINEIDILLEERCQEI